MVAPYAARPFARSRKIGAGASHTGYQRHRTPLPRGPPQNQTHGHLPGSNLDGPNPLRRLHPRKQNAGNPNPSCDVWANERENREQVWAASRPKKYLAGTIAVGTIDQALLATTKAKHAHLRLSCLTRSLLVVDEVHASDRYMETLLGALLRFHQRAGGHALLLSATLG
jgi:hypothetical protein